MMLPNWILLGHWSFVCRRKRILHHWLITRYVTKIFQFAALQVKEDLISYLKVLDTCAMLARLLLSSSWSIWQTTERGIFLKVKSFESSKSLPIIEKKYLLHISTHWVWSGEGKEVSTSMMVNSIWGEFQVWILHAFYTRPVIMDYSFSSFLFSSVKTRVNLTFSLFSDLVCKKFPLDGKKQRKNDMKKSRLQHPKYHSIFMLTRWLGYSSSSSDSR